jgi:cytochrome c biogenesis protein CcmG/thiol:disulfide interchange protein DsbE
VTAAARLRAVGQVLAVTLVAALFGLLVWKLAHDESSDLKARIGRGERPPAPAFTLGRLSGDGDVSLADYRGRPLVLNFWASWCRPCAAEADVLEKTWRTHRDDGLVVLGIDYRDLRSEGRRFASKYGVTYPIVHDGRATLTSRYALTGVPETFVVDRRGRVIGHIEGPVNGREELQDEYRTLVRKALAS